MKFSEAKSGLSAMATTICCKDTLPILERKVKMIKNDGKLQYFEKHDVSKYIEKFDFQVFTHFKFCTNKRNALIEYFSVYAILNFMSLLYGSFFRMAVCFLLAKLEGSQVNMNVFNYENGKWTL